MNQGMQERVAVITGASRGLGAGMATRFAEHGLRIGVCARSEPILADGPEVCARRLDVRDPDALPRFAEEIVERFGRIDLWVNNAGVLQPIAPLREMAAAAFREHLDTNLVGIFNGCRAFIQHVRSRAGEGVLINISSGAGRKPYAGWSAYCAAKAAVDRLTECIRLEEADAGLRAYAVAPGVVDTDMQVQIRGCDPDRFPAVKKFLQLKREERFNTPAFVADRLLEVAFDPNTHVEDCMLRLPDEHA